MDRGKVPNLTIPPLAPPRFASIAKKSWRGDIIAGLTVWGLVVPESIAYTGLAGVKPLAGVWAVILSLPVYFLFGSSRHLVATPTSATAATAGSVIAALAIQDPAKAMAAITLSVGAIFLLAYIYRLGFIVNFISQPINAGFIFGLAIFIIVSQLHKVFGVKKTEGNTFQQAWGFITKLGDTNMYTLLIGVIALVILFGLHYVKPNWPAGLVALAVTTIIVTVTGWNNSHGVDVVGKVPTGFPPLVFPGLNLSQWGIVIVSAFGIVLVAFSEASGVAKEIADEEGHEYHANTDLFAFGVGNLASGCVGGLVAAGSMSSTSTNRAAGAKTEISTLTAAIASLLTALFLAPLISNFAEATLGALIIHAIWHHVNLVFYRKISSYSRAEARIALISTFGVLLFDVMWGLLIAMLCSFLWFLYHTCHIDALTIGPSKKYQGVMVSSDDPSYEPMPNHDLALRFNGQIFYGNVEAASNLIENDVEAERKKEGKKKPFRVILDLEMQEFFDYTTARTLHKLFHRLVDKDCDPVVLMGAHDTLINALVAFGPLPDSVRFTRATTADMIDESNTRPVNDGVAVLAAADRKTGHQAPPPEAKDGST